MLIHILGMPSDFPFLLGKYLLSPQIILATSIRVFVPWEYDGAHFGHRWVQSDGDGIIAHG